MEPKERDILRNAMDVQFRYMFYKRPEFPFLPSIGVKDIFQAFGNEEVGFIGFLHLKHTHRGIGEKEWDSVWYDEKNLNWVKASFTKKGKWEYKLVAIE